MIVQEPYPVTAVTLTECQLSDVLAQAFLNLAQTNAQFSWFVDQVHSREIYDQVSQIIRLGSLAARQRLEQLLPQWVSSLEPAAQGKSVRLQLPLTRAEIAHLLAVTPEHLSRVLKLMEQEGLIRREKGSIVVCNVEQLKNSVDLEG